MINTRRHVTYMDHTKRYDDADLTKLDCTFQTEYPLYYYTINQLYLHAWLFERFDIVNYTFIDWSNGHPLYGIPMLLSFHT